MDFEMMESEAWQAYRVAFDDPKVSMEAVHDAWLVWQAAADAACDGTARTAPYAGE